MPALLLAGISATALALGSLPALAAATLSFDQTLPAPGWFDGSGNPNGGFSVADENGFELAMRTKYRSDPNVIHTPTNVYTVNAGPGANPLLALWNFEFEINVDPTNSTGLRLSGVSATLTVSKNSVPAGTINPLALVAGPTNIADDSLWNGAKVTGPLNYPTSWIAQNSENPGFYPPFDPNEPATYDFVLTVSVGGVPQDALTMEVNVVPEPASLTLLGVALVGLSQLRRKRKPG